jgi:hypothetical protein
VADLAMHRCCPLFGLACNCDHARPPAARGGRAVPSEGLGTRTRREAGGERINGAAPWRRGHAERGRHARRRRAGWGRTAQCRRPSTRPSRFPRSPPRHASAGPPGVGGAPGAASRAHKAPVRARLSRHGCGGAAGTGPRWWAPARPLSHLLCASRHAAGLLPAQAVRRRSALKPAPPPLSACPRTRQFLAPAPFTVSRALGARRPPGQ